MTPSVSTVPAGTVTFDLTNDGTVVHNFRVVKTDLDPDTLPVDDTTFTVVENQLDVRASSSADLSTGETGAVTVDLDPGSYVLICNIATHYDAGMFTAFTVE